MSASVVIALIIYGVVFIIVFALGTSWWKRIIYAVISFVIVFILGIIFVLWGMLGKVLLSPFQPLLDKIF